VKADESIDPMLRRLDRVAGSGCLFEFGSATSTVND
jgi:hypothetical protein